MAEDANHQVQTSPRDGNIRWWDPPVAFFGGTLLGVVLLAMAGLVALAVAMRTGYRPSPDKLVGLLQTSFAANYVALFFSDLGLLAGIWLVARRRIAGPLAHYFSAAGAPAAALAALSGVALSIAVNGGNVVLSQLTGIAFQDSVVERALVPHSPLQFLATIAVVALFAPLVEEFFFRGLFFTWLRQVGGTWPATLISALTFAAVHGQVFIHPGVQGWLYSAELLLAGVLLALWVVRTGSLRTSLAMHAAFNATATAAALLLP